MDYIKVRFYHNIIKKWDAGFNSSDVAFEIEYREYTLDGELVGYGTEQFSNPRWRDEIVYATPYFWDGERRNKGGHRWFDELYTVKIRKSERKYVREFFRRKALKISRTGRCEVIQLRYF